MTDAEFFANGASAMRAQIGAWLVFKGELDLAAKILEQPLPAFSLQKHRTFHPPGSDEMDVGRIEFQTVYAHVTPSPSNHEKRIADLEQRVVELLERLRQVEQVLLLVSQA